MNSKFFLLMLVTGLAIFVFTVEDFSRIAVKAA